MTPESARCLLLVKTAEESDPEGHLISPEERERASAEALSPEGRGDDRATGPLSPDEERFVVRRAELLAASLQDRFPHFSRVRAAGFPGWLTLLFIASALVIGWVSNELGPTRRISILAFPLLGMIAWNLLIYVFLLFDRARGLARHRAAPHGFTSVLARWRPLMGLSADATEQAPVVRTAVRFAAKWTKLCEPLYAQQLRFTLHLSAAALVAGTVGGMYLRGLGFEYRAGWESTFLDSGTVHTFLEVLLGPASWLAGVPLPGAEELAALDWSTGTQGDNAARWIHLYAVTAALFVLAPRLILAAAAALKVWRLRRRLFTPDIGDPYFRRLLTAGRGGGELARVLPYSFKPDAAVRERVRAFLHDLWGARLTVEFREPLGYGEEDEFLGGASAITSAPADYLVILMNLASTPEDENHGVLVGGLARLVADGTIAHRLLVLIDATAYRDRLAEPGFEARLTQRRNAWKRMLSGRGVGFALVDSSPENLREAERAVWQPPPARA